MRRSAFGWMLLALLGGCMSTDRGGGPPAGCPGHYGSSTGPASVPGLQGPYGAPVTMAYPYAASPPSAYAAQQMMNQNVPMSMLQNSGPGSGIMQTSYDPSGGSGLMLAQAGAPGMPIPPGAGMPGPMISPPGVPYGPGMPGGMQGMPGAMPGMPGAMPSMPGAMPGMPGMAGGVPAIPGAGPGFPGPPGAVAALGALPSVPKGLCFPTTRTQVRFVQPVGMKVYWYTKGPDGKEAYSQFPIEVPGRYNFLQAAVYRLKLTNIPGAPGLEVYPTLEVVPANPNTAEFLAHSPVPLSFTEEDFKQIKANNYVVKVIYLPRPEYQDLAFTGIGEIVSTQLEPGANPIEEAQRRGSILLVIRMGSIDQQAPNTPPIDQPGPGGPQLVPGPMGPPGAVPPNMQVPFGWNKGAMGPGGVPPLQSHGPLVAPPQPGHPPLPPQPGGPGGAPPAPQPPSVPNINSYPPPPPPPPLPGSGKAHVDG